MKIFYPTIMTNNLTWEDFQKIEIRCGKILEAKDFPEARKPAYKLKIDFGPEIGIKASSAQITTLYEKTDLIGMSIVAVMNFPPKQIGHFMSEVLVLGTVLSNGDVVLLTPSKPSELGARVA